MENEQLTSASQGKFAIAQGESADTQGKSADTQGKFAIAQGKFAIAQGESAAAEYTVTSEEFAKSSIIKASGAIAIEGVLSLVERRTFNILLAHAYDHLESNDIHVISIPALFDAVEGKLSHYSELKEIVSKFVTTAVQWNVLGKDGRAWVKSSLLSGVEIKEDLAELHYSFSPQLRNLLSSPPYARLSVARQNTLDSKYALTLYELCTDAYFGARGAGETRFLTLAELQTLFGTKYSTWQDIRRRLLDEPIERLHDLDFTITYTTKKRGTKVIAVKLKMKRKLAASPSKAKAGAKTTAAENPSHSSPSTNNASAANAGDASLLLDYETLFTALVPDEQAEVMKQAWAMLPDFLRGLPDDTPSVLITIRQFRNHILHQFHTS